METNRFNIRVYGLLIDDGKILVTDEYQLGTYMTKFPGGGLHFGEGTIDCLKREFMEELGTPVGIISHFYTTDFFQQTMLIPVPMQLISIYYRVHAKSPFTFKTTEIKNDIPPVEGAQNFRWLKISEISKEDFTFPIDKHVIELVKSTYTRFQEGNTKNHEEIGNKEF